MADRSLKKVLFQSQVCFYSGVFQSGVNFKTTRIFKQSNPADSLSGYIKKPRGKEVGGEEAERPKPLLRSRA
jgi:hypothetical protein